MVLYSLRKSRAVKSSKFKADILKPAENGLSIVQIVNKQGMDYIAVIISCYSLSEKRFRRHKL